VWAGAAQVLGARKARGWGCVVWQWQRRALQVVNRGVFAQLRVRVVLRAHSLMPSAPAPVAGRAAARPRVVRPYRRKFVARSPKRDMEGYWYRTGLRHATQHHRRSAHGEARAGG